MRRPKVAGYIALFVPLLAVGLSSAVLAQQSVAGSAPVPTAADRPDVHTAQAALPGSLVYSFDNKRYRVDLRTGKTTIIGGAPPEGSFVGSDGRRYWIEFNASQENFIIYTAARDGTGRKPLLDRRGLSAQFPTFNETPNHITLSADAKQLYLDPCEGDEIGRRCTLFAIDLKTNRLRNLGLSLGWGARVAPNGVRALGTNKMYRPEGGAYFPSVLFQRGKEQVELYPGTGVDVLWLADGGLVYTTDGDWTGRKEEYNLIVADRRGRNVRFLVKAQRIAAIALAPNGRHVAYLTRDGGELWTINLDGTGKHKIATIPEGSIDLLWSPNQ